MITGVGTVNLFVNDQEAAKGFYTDTLGFETRNDATLDGFRWLTVGPKGQPGIDFLLVVPAPPMFSPEDAAALRGLLAKGAMPGGVLLTDDCRRDYEALSGPGRDLPPGAGRTTVRHRGAVPRQLRQLVLAHPAPRRLTAPENHDVRLQNKTQLTRRWLGSFVSVKGS